MIDVGVSEMVDLPAWAAIAKPKLPAMLRPSLSLDDFASHSEWIAGAVRTLLSHYFDPKHTGEMMRMGAADWIDILEPFSAECIERARRHWIENERRRPTPADIKLLCFKVCAGLI